MLAFANSIAAEGGRPESVFISWLLWQPRGADLPAEALKEVQRLARYANRDPEIVRLRSLFATLAGQIGRPH
jgi:hypothetical protein